MEVVVWPISWNDAMLIVKYLRRLTVIGLVSSLSVIPALAAQRPFANTPTARIDELRQAFNSAYNAGNATAIADLLAEDAVWMPPGEPAVVGRSAVESRYAAQFSTTHSSFALNPGEIRVLANLAWLRGSYLRVDTPIAGNPSTMITGKYLMTFSRERGDWKIINDCWNSDATPLQVDARSRSPRHPLDRGVEVARCGEHAEGDRGYQRGEERQMGKHAGTPE
jgi:uncharacterized protein (TIGR02246 family)